MMVSFSPLHISDKACYMWHVLYALQRMRQRSRRLCLWHSSNNEEPRTQHSTALALSIVTGGQPWPHVWGWPLVRRFGPRHVVNHLSFAATSCSVITIYHFFPCMIIKMSALISCFHTCTHDLFWNEGTSRYLHCVTSCALYMQC